MNGDGFHQKILGAPAGLAIPKQMGNMMQSLEFIFFCSVSKKSKKLVHHGHPRGVLECSIFGILAQCKKKSKCDEW